MNDEEAMDFASPQEEIEYWRDQTYSLRAKIEYMNNEHNIFVADSAELEREMEEEVRRVETANADLRAKNEKYKYEIADLKEKYQNAQLKAGEGLASIERELQFVRSQQEYYQSRTRELEQDNDDLERNGRAAKSSLQAMETRLSQAMEENSHLMGEVEAKKMLADEVQRLKDELKDMNLELTIVRNRNSRAVPQSQGLSKSSANVVDGGREEDPSRAFQGIMTRVRDLESRLAGARSKVTPLIGASGQYATLSSRISRNRTVSTPKSTSLFPSDGASSNTGSSLQKPTNMRSRGATRSGDTRIPSSALMDSRLERSRLLRESYRKNLGEASNPQTVPQQRPAA
ncbi:hypothetical protein COEREDRAFT_81643 [Coemansia reversa NRRL 1564]|uniref:NUDE domain-containing protein n=1 Tax=Coemansia reversa (strain ATCC 12441 / NRRL 1564) TaxID=763665 RepID=A0A2G5BAB7_COERN|nr:hypothetical protein COEREDRAFT_81643 [Coemansia reversa NRRL 1564]|eukprot:PIA15940.1 hypothetical protein COEREDRAFT_81643 [Coemansia reversa NRRL 1564]